jgi:uncharacterized protein YcbK (DUF882 family)
MFCDDVDSSRRRFVACSTGAAAILLPKALMFGEALSKNELVGLDFIEDGNELVTAEEFAKYAESSAVFEPEILTDIEPQEILSKSEELAEHIESAAVFEPEILTSNTPSTSSRNIASSTAERVKTTIAARPKKVITQPKQVIAKHDKVISKPKRVIAKKKSSYSRKRLLTARGERKVRLKNLHTGENLKATYWADGKYISQTMRDVAHFLRDHRTGDRHRIDAGLLDILHDINVRTGSRHEFHIISGYRSPKTNKMLSSRSKGVAKRSLHMLGKALDIRLPGTDLRNLRKVALSVRAGGVGYYPQANFLHVDTGRFRTWG